MRHHRGTQWRKTEENLFSDTAVLLLANSPTVCLWKIGAFQESTEHYYNITKTLLNHYQCSYVLGCFFLRFSANITKNIPIHYGNITKTDDWACRVLLMVLWSFEIYFFRTIETKKPPDWEAFLFGELPDLKDQHWDQMLLGLISFPRCEKTDFGESAFFGILTRFERPWSPSMIDHIK